MSTLKQNFHPTKQKLNRNIETLSFLPYGLITQSLLTQVKFNRRKDIAKWLAQFIVNQTQENFHSFFTAPIDLWVAIPLHPAKQKTRGFNQVETLFSPFLEKFNTTFSPGINRKTNTPSLFSLSAKERKNCMKNVFEIANYRQPSFQEKHICIVDDIVTSGATLTSLSHYLLQIGAKSITCLTLCATPHTSQ